MTASHYGSGKTFFMNLVRGAALEHQLVVAHGVT
ncbi:MAG: BREX system ATP-binding domain-containing protein [Rhodoferax sp.]